MGPLVRLANRDDWWVVCALTCGARITRVVDLPHLHRGDNPRSLVFDPSWALRRDEPIWYQIDRAKSRRDPEGGAHQPAGRLGFEVIALPCGVICPACGFREVLNASALRVDTLEYRPGRQVFQLISWNVVEQALARHDAKDTGVTAVL
ncbi:MAG: hypothetical protein GEU73_11105 [Chloroflexi bacterium]|nr:hypothetical protein [Chloroflexota bacterium]